MFTHADLLDFAKEIQDFRILVTPRVEVRINLLILALYGTTVIQYIENS